MLQNFRGRLISPKKLVYNVYIDNRPFQWFELITLLDSVSKTKIGELQPSHYQSVPIPVADVYSCMMSVFGYLSTQTTANGDHAQQNGYNFHISIFI